MVKDFLTFYGTLSCTTMKIVVTPCNLLDVNQLLRETRYLQFEGRLFPF
jgi:hypothetical protein